MQTSFFRNPSSQKTAARQFAEFWRGERVEKGQPIARMHYSHSADPAEPTRLVLDAFKIG